MTSAEFDRDYFEHGISTRKSLYENYHYIPHRSHKEANVFIETMQVDKTEVIIDFGCAKGFFVKALVEMGYNAYGMDISEYALRHCEPDVYERIARIWNFEFDVGFCKDTLEHCHGHELDGVIEQLKCAKRWLIIVPLSDDGFHYNIIDYDKDITHHIKMNKKRWEDIFERHGFIILKSVYHIPGIKDKWYRKNPEGNLFLVVQCIQ